MFRIPVPHISYKMPSIGLCCNIFFLDQDEWDFNKRKSAISWMQEMVIRFIVSN